MSDKQLYRLVDGYGLDDQAEWEELEKHTESRASYDRRGVVATDSMPDGVIIVRDLFGDLDSYMVPVGGDV